MTLSESVVASEELYCDFFILYVLLKLPIYLGRSYSDCRCDLRLDG